MTTFWDQIEAEIGDDEASHDIRLMVAVLHHFDFDGYSVRLWRGQGRLFTEDGQIWLGTVDAAGQDRLSAPGFSDGRDGSSALLNFGLPYIDRETYLALRDERWRASGRQITRSLAYINADEGLRPSTPYIFDASFTMQSVSARESVDLDGLRIVRRYSLSVSAKNGNAGRSQARRGTYTPAGQRDRAFEMYGIEGDQGCDFVPELANKTFLHP